MNDVVGPGGVGVVVVGASVTVIVDEEPASIMVIHNCQPIMLVLFVSLCLFVCFCCCFLFVVWVFIYGSFKTYTLIGGGTVSELLIFSFSVSFIYRSQTITQCFPNHLFSRVLIVV